MVDVIQFITELYRNWAAIPFVSEVVAGIVAALIVYIIARFWEAIPGSLAEFQLPLFWGKGVKGNEFTICYGALQDTRKPIKDDGTPHFRYAKQYHDDRAHKLIGPRTSIVGTAELRAVSYLVNALSPYRKTPIPLQADHSVFEQLAGTFVALGSPSSNEMTDWVLRQPSNTFLEFGQMPDEDATTFIEDKQTGKKFVGFIGPVKHDYGAILRLRNEQSPRHPFFVCAGLGDSGTSAAAWYLARNWRKLRAEFGAQPFGVVVKVAPGRDNSACRVFPAKRTWRDRVWAWLRIPRKPSRKPVDGLCAEGAGEEET